MKKETRKFIYYEHHTYQYRLDQNMHKMIDGEEYIIEFTELNEHTDSNPDIYEFSISGCFIIDPGWNIIGNDGTFTPIPGVEGNSKICVSTVRGRDFYIDLVNTIIKEAFITWINIR